MSDTEQQPEPQQEESGEIKLAPHQPENQVEIDSRSVYVGNVEFSTTPNELNEFFAPAGVVNRVTILCNKYNGRPKGYAYVEFEDKESVEKAIDQLNGKESKGRPVTVAQKRTNVPGLGNRGERRGGFRGGRGRGYRGRGYRGGFRGRGRGRGGYGSRSSRDGDDDETAEAVEHEHAQEESNDVKVEDAK